MTSGVQPGGSARRKIWLASYPRSGNTLLRTILYHCFGLPTTTIYGPGDLGRNAALERAVGHFDLANPLPEPAVGMPLLVKTHTRPWNAAPTIYVVRDGLPATVSLWEFLKGRIPFRAVVLGVSGFGTWSSHLAAWQPWARPDTLLLRYEDMTEKLPKVLEQLSRFLDWPIVSSDLPSRSVIAAVDGRWVREPSDWRAKVSWRDARLFQAVNGNMLSRLGYSPHGATEGASPGPHSASHRYQPQFALRWEKACWRLYVPIHRRLTRSARHAQRDPGRRPPAVARKLVARLTGTGDAAGHSPARRRAAPADTVSASSSTSGAGTGHESAR